MRERGKTLVLSIFALIVATVLVVGATFALFTDRVAVNNHLEAGNLDVGLDQISYTERVLNDQGLMEERTESTTKDLTTDGSTLFIVNKAVPTSWYQTTIKVTNDGSTAFDFGMRVLWNEEGDATAEQIKFAQQIKITVSGAQLTQAKEFYLVDCGKNDVNLGALLKGAGSETFTVKAEFVDNEANNDVMLISLNFDVQVFATQKTE